MGVAGGEYQHLFLGPNGDGHIPEGLEYDKDKELWQFSTNVRDDFRLGINWDSGGKIQEESDRSIISSRMSNSARRRPEALEVPKPFKAREIPKEVNIDQTESSPLKRHKKKVEQMKNRKSSMNLNSLVITLSPTKDLTSAKEELSSTSKNWNKHRMASFNLK